MKLLQYLIGLVFWVLPRTILVRMFKCSKSRFYFSARVAIYRIALSLKNKVNVALVPEYICNVVHFAFLEAGYTLVKYKCDDDFEPNIIEIVELGNKYPNSILCLAPLYGADGGESWVTTNAGRAWRKKNEIFLIFDICQDFSRAISTNIINENMFAVISSFNNKSFPGLMGALVRSDIRDNAYRLANISESARLLKILAFSCLFFLSNIVLSHFKRHNPRSRYEYSDCLQFPYDFNHSAAVKIQIAIGLAGKLLLPIYAAKKSAYLNNRYILPKKTPHFRSSSIIISKNVNQKLIFKPPYSLQNEPNHSLKPNLNSCYFRGYDDLI